MKYLSVCSGIEAATVAWHPLGWSPVAFAEVEKFPSAVLAHHYPTVPNRGDMTRFKEWPDAAFDLLVGGTPCQSFSVAGLRKGLDDPRGNLALTFLAIADRYRPRWVVWENVPGVLSSVSHAAPDPYEPPPPVDLGCDGAEVETEDEYDAEEVHAFNCLLAGFSELGYLGAYGSLDAQYAGLAQRRERVFAVFYLGDWRRAAAVLFERESLSGHPAPRREAGESVAPTLAGCSNGGGANGPGRDVDTCDSLIAGTLVGGASAGGHGRFLSADAAAQNFLISHPLRADGFDASEDGTGRGTPIVTCFDDPRRFDARGVHGGGEHGNLHPPLNRTVGQQIVAFSAKDSGADAGELAPTLRAGGHDTSHANGGVMPAVAYGLRSDAGREGTAKTPSPDAEGRVRLRDPGFNVYEEQAPTIDAGAPHAVAFDARQSDVLQYGEKTGPLDTDGHSIAVHSAMQVRRLTPRECERLQGFPDDYTLIPYRGKPAADGPRYKALGNSMAVPVMAWIGQRIQMVESLTDTIERTA